MSQSRIITIASIIIGTAVIASTLYAQSLQITSNIENATIMVRNIFLSPSGRDIDNASIRLKGEQGNVSISGDLVLSNDRYSCPDSDGTGCVLAVQSGGSTTLTEVALPHDNVVREDDVTITGDSFFAKKGGSTDHLNRSANEIVFADPDIVPNAADAHLRVNIKDVVRATSTGTPKMFDVNGAINSRTSLEVSSPLDTTQKSNYNLTNTARTDFILTKGDSATNEQSVRMKVGYHNGSQYTRQDMIIQSLQPNEDINGEQGCLQHAPFGLYNIAGTRIYKSGFPNSAFSSSTDNPTWTFARMNNVPQWKNGNIFTQVGAANRIAVWPSRCGETQKLADAGTTVTLGYIYNNTGGARTVYVGIFGDTDFQLKLNGNTIAQSIPSFNPDGGSNADPHRQMFHIIPVNISPGLNYFNAQATSDGNVVDALGFIVYDNTAVEIRDATNDNELNILFSTEELIGTQTLLNACPEGWSLDTSNPFNMQCIPNGQQQNQNSNGIAARLGINTSGYPEHTLDVNGETLSQETLTVGYLNDLNIVSNIRQAVGIVIQNPSPSAQTAIRSQSCDRTPIPATLQCSNGNCSTISLSGNEIASFTCYDWVGTNTTMQRAQMYQIMSLYSSVTMIANTDTQSVGINTLVPQSTLDVNGDTYLDGSGYIVGTPNNIASITNGNTSIQLKELNNTESTPYTGGNTNCKGLSVDEAGHIILVQLPRTMCGATGSIVTPPTPVINGVCGSSHNTTGTSAPTTNLCTTGTASSIAGSGPWTWSCAGSNGGTSASCQMNKQGVLTRIYNCDNKPDHTIWNTVSSYTQTSSNGGTTWIPTSSVTIFGGPSSTGCNFICDEGYERDGVSCILDPLYCTEVLDPGGCFIEDTLVTLADGSTKKIQDISIGDILKGVSTTNTVVALIRPQLGNKHLYAINDTHEFVTANHPFLTTEGWKSLDPEATRTEIPDLTVGLLEIGDTLITTSGTIVIQSISTKTALPSTQLYNFELDGDHTYFANGFAVHNKYDVGQCPYVNDGEGNYIPSPSCTWYSYNAPVSGHPQRKLYPNLFGAGYSCTSSRSSNNGQYSCASYGMRCDRDARICGFDVVSMVNICEAYCENNPNYTGPSATPACNGLNVAMCNNNTPRCQWTDPTLL